MVQKHTVVTVWDTETQCGDCKVQKHNVVTVWGTETVCGDYGTDTK